AAGAAPVLPGAAGSRGGHRDLVRRHVVRGSGPRLDSLTELTSPASRHRFLVVELEGDADRGGLASVPLPVRTSRDAGSPAGHSRGSPGGIAARGPCAPSVGQATLKPSY